MKKGKKTIRLTESEMVSLIENIVNDKNRRNVTKMYGEERRNPTLHLGHNNYSFELVEDTGTGKAYSNLILLDLAFLETTALPFLIHDSVLFKNIQNDAVAKLIGLYESTGKQVFIAIGQSPNYDYIPESLKDKVEISRGRVKANDNGQLEKAP